MFEYIKIEVEEVKYFKFLLEAETIFLAAPAKCMVASDINFVGYFASLHNIFSLVTGLQATSPHK